MIKCVLYDAPKEPIIYFFQVHRKQHDSLIHFLSVHGVENFLIFEDIIRYLPTRDEAALILGNNGGHDLL